MIGALNCSLTPSRHRHRTSWVTRNPDRHLLTAPAHRKAASNNDARMIIRSPRPTYTDEGYFDNENAIKAGQDRHQDTAWQLPQLHRCLHHYCTKPARWEDVRADLCRFAQVCRGSWVRTRRRAGDSEVVEKTACAHSALQTLKTLKGNGPNTPLGGVHAGVTYVLGDPDTVV